MGRELIKKNSIIFKYIEIDNSTGSQIDPPHTLLMQESAELTIMSFFLVRKKRNEFHRLFPVEGVVDTYMF